MVSFACAVTLPGAHRLQDRRIQPIDDVHRTALRFAIHDAVTLWLLVRWLQRETTPQKHVDH